MGNFNIHLVIARGTGRHQSRFEFIGGVGVIKALAECLVLKGGNTHSAGSTNRSGDASGERK